MKHEKCLWVTRKELFLSLLFDNEKLRKKVDGNAENKGCAFRPCLNLVLGCNFFHLVIRAVPYIVFHNTGIHYFMFKQMPYRNINDISM